MESRFKHNEDIVVNFGKSGILSGKINSIKFSDSKVYYDVLLYPFKDNEYSQILQNIDSYFVEKAEDRFNNKSNIGIIDNIN